LVILVDYPADTVASDRATLRSELTGGMSWTAAGASDEVGPELTAGERARLRSGINGVAAWEG
jgi:hypothetical protein